MDDIHADQLISHVQADGFHPHGSPVGGPHIALLEANGFSELGGHQKLPAAVCELGRDQAVALKVHRFDPALPGIGEGLQGHLDNVAALGNQDDESRLKALDRYGSGDPLIRLQL